MTRDSKNEDGFRSRASRYVSRVPNSMSDVVAMELRLDKWLWFARFFKSRSQATDAVAGGLVHINGERTKPARAVHVGDTLAITRGEVQIEVIVQSLLVRRGPASEAQKAYTETAASIAQRERRREQLRAAPAPSGRPDKHGRRELRSLRGRA